MKYTFYKITNTYGMHIVMLPNLYPGWLTLTNWGANGSRVRLLEGSKELGKFKEPGFFEVPDILEEPHALEEPDFFEGPDALEGPGSLEVLSNLKHCGFVEVTEAELNTDPILSLFLVLSGTLLQGKMKELREECKKEIARTLNYRVRVLQGENPDVQTS